MTELEQRIAQVAEELRKVEEEMRRYGLAVSPETVRSRRWELGRSMAAFYQRWQEFMVLHRSSTGYRSLAHAPRPD